MCKLLIGMRIFHVEKSLHIAEQGRALRRFLHAAGSPPPPGADMGSDGYGFADPGRDILRLFHPQGVKMWSALHRHGTAAGRAAFILHDPRRGRRVDHGHRSAAQGGKAEDMRRRVRNRRHVVYVNDGMHIIRIESDQPASDPHEQDEIAHAAAPALPSAAISAGRS